MSSLKNLFFLKKENLKICNILKCQVLFLDVDERYTPFGSAAVAAVEHLNSEILMKARSGAGGGEALLQSPVSVPFCMFTLKTCFF